MTANPAGQPVKSAMKRLKSNRGFTLIELMIAITIAGILLVIAIPSFQYSILDNRVKTPASDLHVNFLLARSEAIKLNRDVNITWKTSGWDITYVKAGTTTTETIRSYEDVSPDVTTLCDTNGDNTADACPASITINRNGRLANAPFSRWFYTAKSTKVRMRCVSIGLSGMPQVEVDSDNNTGNGC